MSSVGALIEPRGSCFQRWRHPFAHNYLNVSFSSALYGARGITQPGPWKMTGSPPFSSTRSNVYSKNGHVDIYFQKSHIKML